MHKAFITFGDKQQFNSGDTRSRNFYKKLLPETCIQ